MSREDELDRLLRSSDRIEAPVGAAFFTARVLGSLPSRLHGTGLTPRTRALLLTVFHGGAVVLAWAVLWAFAPESVGALADRAHGVFESSESRGLGLLQGLDVADMLGALAVVLALGAAAIVALRGGISHTPPA